MVKRYYFDFCKLNCKWRGLCSWCHSYSQFEIKYRPCRLCIHKNDIKYCYDCEYGDNICSLFAPVDRGCNNG